MPLGIFYCDLRPETKIVISRDHLKPRWRLGWMDGDPLLKPFFEYFAQRFMNNRHETGIFRSFLS
jgi:hypothetical protein